MDIIKIKFNSKNEIRLIAIKYIKVVSNVKYYFKIVIKICNDLKVSYVRVPVKNNDFF